MIAIWLGVVAVALLASAYVVLRARGFGRGRAAVVAGAGADARTAFALRRRELEAEALAQGMDRADADALGEELALDALDESPTDRPAPAESPRRTVRAPLPPLLLGGFAAAALSVGLYALWGEPHARTLADAARLMAEASEGDDAALAQLLDALSSRVQRKPNDRDGLFLLGHARMRSDDFEGAAEAFAALHELAGANPQVDLAWAQARYLADGGSISTTTRAIVDRVLASNPNHQELLELLAMDALRRGDYASGARHLIRALGQPLPAPRRRLLAETLALARARLDPGRPLVEVAIDASWPTSETPWLMVFARPPDGGPPVAAVRLPAERSQTVVLDDAATMIDGARLGASGPLRVVARLSQSGEATAADIESSFGELVDPAIQPRIRLRLDATGDGAEDAAAVESAP